MRRHAKAATAGSTKRLGRSKPALLLCVLAASVAALALVVGSASGATTRFLVETFGSAAQPTFPADRGMAVDQGASQLYVIDSTNDTISRFNADGTAANFGALGSNVIDGEGTGDETPLGHLAFEANRQREQLAIDESGGATDGNVYATRSASDVVDVFSSSGEYKGTLSESTGTGAFGEPCGVAVDSSGNVYVGDRGDDRIHVYEPAGAVPVNADNTASFATVTDPCTLAAGAGATAGFLFVNASTGAQLRKVDATTGEVKYEIATGGSTVSVDPATGHVFVARNTGSNSQVDEYDASGAASATLVSSFQPGSTVEGIALNSAAEQVYVARSGTENVEVFGPAVVAPDVVTSPPSSNTGVRATLAGTVNPDGVELDECFFEWGQGLFSTPYTDTVPCAETPAEIGAGTTPVAVHADLDGLVPQGTNYHYRLVAVNPNATVDGSNQNFTTPDTVVTEAATGITPTEATLNGTVNPDGTALTECVFEWGPEKGPFEEIQLYPEAAPCVPGPGTIGAGTSPVAVSAALSDLHPGTRYAYRLKAANANGPITGDTETVQTTGPVILAAWAESVVYSEATLKAQVDPEGQATTYRIEYGETAAYGSETPELNVGSDSSVHELTRFLEGLKPGTTYHYRVVATNGAAENTGPDQAFTTYSPPAASDCPNEALRSGPSASLPDCRAYEMVSPVDKNGGDIYVSTYTGQFDSDAPIRASYNQAAVGGGKITYSSGTAFGDQTSARGVNQYIATRGANGWSTHGVNAPLGLTLGEPLVFLGDTHSQFKLFTPDLSRAWVTDTNRVPLTPDASEGWPNLYQRDNLTDSYEALTRTEPAAGAVPFNAVEYYFHEVHGASADGSHVVFAVRGGLTPNTTGGSRWQTYDYSGGELHLVSVLPDGSTDPNHSSAGSGYHAGQFATDRLGNVGNAISEDGSRIFWTSTPVGGGLTNGGTLYVRENPAEPQSALNGSNECTEPAKACTRLIAAGTNHFWGASPEGSKLVYSTGSIEGGALAGPLSRFDVDAETATQIAATAGGVVGMSGDTSRVYFTSKEALASGAVAGEWNLYLDHEGAKTLIATVSEEDRTGFGEGSSANVSVGGIDSTGALFHAARVTPDGRHLAFQSARSLTGYDNTDAVNGEPLIEIYHYDAVTEELTCASCNPSGARGVGYEMIEPFPLVENLSRFSELWAAAWLQTEGRYNYASRALSEDGNRLYFNAYDALVPEDTNGAQDVYQWEAQGTGTCEQEGGCVSLISTGKSPQKSEFVDATPDGSEVFFETLSSIDPRDPGLIDIYSARVNGGFPVPPEPPACEGDACQDIPAAPTDPTPSSAAFKGAADPKPRRGCRLASKRAAQLSRQAKRLRLRARGIDSSAQSKGLRRRAARRAKAAKRFSKTAARCRRAARGVGR